MRSVGWIVMVVLTVNDICCEDMTTTSTMKSKLMDDSCVLNNVTNATLIKSSCDNQLSNQTIIHSLSFRDSRFKVFPKIFDLFSDLHTVDISHSGIEYIESTTFNNAGNLSSLYIYGNNVSKLSNYTFSKANNLLSLDFGNCSIVTIETHAFDGLSKLERLDLSYNNIKHLEADIFHPLYRLEVIRLTNNKIEVINKDIFARNAHLQIAYFSRNNILIVELASFVHSQLKSLDLGFNNLYNIDLSIQKNLTTLTVTNNHLNKLIVPPTVEEMHAENNSITVIRSDEENNLKKLFLSSNHLLNLHNLSYFGKLEFLDLSMNQLSTVKFSDLKNLTKLKQLKLTGNTLTEINATDVRTNLPSLQLIELSYAHWSKEFVSKLIDELKDHKITLTSDPNEIPDNGTTNQPLPSSTSNIPTTTSNIPTTASKIPTTTSNIPTTTSTSKITDKPLPEPKPNSEKVEKSLDQIVQQLNVIEDDMKKSNSVNNAKYDALVSTFKTYEILLMIMFISGLMFGLYKITLFSRKAFHNMRYRRAQSRDPLFNEQDL